MSKVQTMPLEIWTDINGNAARTQFKGGTKYIRADAQATVEALQAQFRHMTKERDIQKEVADNQAWHVRQLRQAIEHVHKAWAAKTPHEFHAWFAQNVALARAAQIDGGSDGKE